MKTRKHMPKAAPLVASVMMVVTCLAQCAQNEMSPDKQSAEKIEARIEKAFDAWSSEPQETRPARDTMVRRILDSLSEDEIRLVAQYVHGIDVEEDAFRRWARFDPAGALKAVRTLEDANAAEIRLAGTGLEGGPGEGMSDYVFGLYLSVIDGWSEVAPKAAWESFKKREGSLSNSLVIEDYLSSFYRVLFEHLAKVDPDLAFEELMKGRTYKFEVLNTASKLGGYCRGAPRGRDWAKEVAQLVEHRLDDERVFSEIRTSLMGRWLEDAPEAAEKWFREGDVENIHWSNVISTPLGGIDPFVSGNPVPEQQSNPGSDPFAEVWEKRRNDLGSAAGYWAARDFPAAWRWMKSYHGFQREGFGMAVLHGADVFLSKRDAYFLGGEGARSFILEQAARLPDEADRTKCVSMVQLASDTTEKLHGELKRPNKPLEFKARHSNPH